MSETLEALYTEFLESPPAGALADELHRISAELDTLIDGGTVTHSAVAAYEEAAMRLAYAAGFTAALEAVAA